MLCSISQKVPDEPVLSPSSGCIFEKRLIHKYISEYGEDPVSKEPLEKDQLIEIKQYDKGIKRKDPDETSIPELLDQLRNEWDASVLDSFEIKRQLTTTRQELSHALYQLEAAYRVIEKLKKQVDRLEKATEEDPNEQGSDDQWAHSRWNDVDIYLSLNYT